MLFPQLCLSKECERPLDWTPELGLDQTVLSHSNTLTWPEPSSALGPTVPPVTEVGEAAGTTAPSGESWAAEPERPRLRSCLFPPQGIATPGQSCLTPAPLPSGGP